jgi:SPP1 gp7 family putative phage head morphogenesis protein
MRVKIPSKRDPASGELMGKIEVDWRDIGSEHGAEQFTSTLDALAKDIRRKLLFPDKLGFTTDNTGALSQSEVFWKLFLKVVKKIHGRLEDIYNPKIKQLVDINFPNVEKYPKFKFNEIDHEIEYEMLNMLLDKGVIDKRESWIRGKVDIPQLDDKEQEEIDAAKEEDIKKQQEQFAAEAKVNGGFGNGNNVSNNSFGNGGNDAGKRGNRSSNIQDKKPKQFKATRPESFQKVKDQFDSNENDFILEYDRIHKEQSDRIIRAVKSKKIVENKDLKAVNKLSVQHKEFKQLFSTYYSKLYFEGKRDAANEFKAKAGKMKLEFKNGKYTFQLDDELQWLDRAWIERFLKDVGALGTLTKEDRKYLTDLRDRSFRITGETSERILKAARQVIDNGIRGNLTTAGVVGQLQEVLSEDRKRFALTIARTNASDAYNSGRMNEFLSPEIEPFVEAFQYNAILDNSTTAFCAAHDGQIIKKSDPELSTIVPPNHFNCRSLLTSVLIGQDELIEDSPEWGENKNIDGEEFDMNKKSVRKPADGFGG